MDDDDDDDDGDDDDDEISFLVEETGVLGGNHRPTIFLYVYTHVCIHVCMYRRLSLEIHCLVCCYQISE